MPRVCSQEQSFQIQPYDTVEDAHFFVTVLTLAKDTPEFNFKRFSKLLVKPLQVLTSAKSCEILTMYRER